MPGRERRMEMIREEVRNRDDVTGRKEGEEGFGSGVNGERRGKES